MNRDFIYFDSLSLSKPFTGKAYGKVFSRGEEYILSEYSFQKGIPDGAWKTYGYENEILQEGVFTPVSGIQEMNTSFPGLKRININKFTEGDDHEIINIFFISSVPSIDSAEYLERKNRTLHFLEEKGFLNRLESPKVKRFVIESGEF